MTRHAQPDTRENAPRLVDSFMKAVSLFIDQGHNLIVDVVCPNTIFENLRIAARDSNLFVVGLKASVETLRQRENKRDDREGGLAESQYEGMYRDIDYDLEIDNSRLDIEQVGQAIIKTFDARMRLNEHKPEALSLVPFR